MGYANYQQQRPVEPSPETVAKVQGKGLARIYGYMGLGLAITAIVAVLVAWFFSSHVNSVSSLQKQDNWVIAYLATIIGSGIACLILGIWIPVRMVRNKRSLWVPYILYCLFMGALLSIILVAGISWAIIGEAFGISAAAFLIMFFIGYFAKKDLSLFAYIGIAILSMAMLVIAFWMIIAAIQGGFQTLSRLDIVYSVIVCVIMLLFVVIDGIRVKRIAAAGESSTNLHLYCAYVMYSDFITLLVRVIYILARTQRN